MQDIVYFDLETKRTIRDAGGDDRKRDMGMSVGVTYSTARGEYRIFSEKRVDELIDQLMRADMVVGFNLIHFDYEVLMGYTILDLPGQVRTLDILKDIEARLGHRLSLDAIASASVGAGKTAGGIDAIKWWREGRVLDVAEYCCFDVKVTRLVHEFGCKNRRLNYADRFGQRREVEVDWTVPGRAVVA